MAEPAHPRFPALTVLLSISGWAVLAISNHTKLISTTAAAVGAVIWTALVGLTSKIWARAEKTVVELAGDALDILILDFTSRYRKRYFQHLQDRHRTFDVKGLSTQGIYALEIEQVYVELAVDPTQAFRVSPDPISKPIQGSQHDIWTLISSPQMKKQNFAILGAPGTGKTTLLKHTTLELAANHGKSRGIRLMPVLLFIRDHAAAIGSKPSQTIGDVAEEAASRMGIPAPPGWFGREFRRGRCLVMLDGLDEVADANLRKTVAEWVESQMQAFGTNRFLVTSRPFGYKSNPLGQVTVLGVRPLSSEQVERFIDNWYLANEAMSAQKNDEGVRIAARELAADLLKRIRAKPALAELTVNPLLLTMIANVHRYRSSLPGRRVELYAEICEVFLGKRQQARGMELQLTPAQKKRVLQPLAFHLMRAGKRELPLAEAVQTVSGPLALVNAKMSSEEFLRNVENSSGLLLERENDVYGFAHLTFQEFLAASHIVEERLKKGLAERVAIPWWHEVIRLFVALSDATLIVEACIAGGESEVVKLTLAVECLEEALTVRPDLRSRVESIVIEGLEHPEPERARLAAETKLALRLRRLTRVDDDLYIDNDLISCAEYQLFLNDRLSAGDCRQPDHWNGTHFPDGSARHAVLGVRSADAEEFCSWLSARDRGAWTYQIPDRDLCDQLSGGAGYWASTPDGLKLCGVGAPWQITAATLSARYLADLREIGVEPPRSFNLRDSPVLARAIDLAPVSPIARDAAEAHHGPTARDLANARARDIAQAIARRRSGVRGIFRVRAIEHAKVRSIFRAIDRANARAIARDPASSIARPLDDAIHFACSGDRNRVNALTVDRTRALARDLALDRDPARAIDRAINRNQIGAHVERNARFRHERGTDRAFSRSVLLEVALTLEKDKDRYWNAGWYARLQRFLHNPSAIYSMLIDDFLRAYVGLVNLEERIEGKLSPFEGIRITRVRKTATSTASGRPFRLTP
jgi:hypothetical protein